MVKQRVSVLAVDATRLRVRVARVATEQGSVGGRSADERNVARRICNERFDWLLQLWDADVSHWMRI